MLYRLSLVLTPSLGQGLKEGVKLQAGVGAKVGAGIGAVKVVISGGVAAYMGCAIYDNATQK